MPAEQVNEFWFFTYVIETLKNILITIAIIMCLRAKNKEPLEKKQPNLDFTP